MANLSWGVMGNGPGSFSSGASGFAKLLGLVWEESLAPEGQGAMRTNSLPNFAWCLVKDSCDLAPEVSWRR